MHLSEGFLLSPPPHPPPTTFNQVYTSLYKSYINIWGIIWISVATKLRRSSKLRRFLSKDPSSSSSSVHFQMPKNLRSFEDFRPKIAKIFWENLPIFWTKIVWKSLKICNFLITLNFNFPHIMLSSTAGKICSSCCLEENF